MSAAPRKRFTSARAREPLHWRVFARVVDPLFVACWAYLFLFASGLALHFWADNSVPSPSSPSAAPAAVNATARQGDGNSTAAAAVMPDFDAVAFTFAVAGHAVATLTRRAVVTLALVVSTTLAALLLWSLRMPPPYRRGRPALPPHLPWSLADGQWGRYVRRWCHCVLVLGVVHATGLGPDLPRATTVGAALTYMAVCVVAWCMDVTGWVLTALRRRYRPTAAAATAAAAAAKMTHSKPVGRQPDPSDVWIEATLFAAAAALALVWTRAGWLPGVTPTPSAPPSTDSSPSTTTTGDSPASPVCDVHMALVAWLAASQLAAAVYVYCCTLHRGAERLVWPLLRTTLAMACAAAASPLSPMVSLQPLLPGGHSASASAWAGPLALVWVAAVDWGWLARRTWAHLILRAADDDADAADDDDADAADDDDGDGQERGDEEEECPDCWWGNGAPSHTVADADFDSDAENCETTPDAVRYAEPVVATAATAQGLAPDSAANRADADARWGWAYDTQSEDEYGTVHGMSDDVWPLRYNRDALDGTKGLARIVKCVEALDALNRAFAYAAAVANTRVTRAAAATDAGSADDSYPPARRRAPPCADSSDSSDSDADRAADGGDDDSDDDAKGSGGRGSDRKASGSAADTAQRLAAAAAAADGWYLTPATRVAHAQVLNTLLAQSERCTAQLLQVLGYPARRDDPARPELGLDVAKAIPLERPPARTVHGVDKPLTSSTPTGPVQPHEHWYYRPSVAERQAQMQLNAEWAQLWRMLYPVERCDEQSLHTASLHADPLVWALWRALCGIVPELFRDGLWLRTNGLFLRARMLERTTAWLHVYRRRAQGLYSPDGFETIAAAAASAAGDSDAAVVSAGGDGVALAHVKRLMRDVGHNAVCLTRIAKLPADAAEPTIVLVAKSALAADDTGTGGGDAKHATGPSAASPSSDDAGFASPLRQWFALHTPVADARAQAVALAARAAHGLQRALVCALEVWSALAAWDAPGTRHMWGAAGQGVSCAALMCDLLECVTTDHALVHGLRAPSPSAASALDAPWQPPRLRSRYPAHTDVVDAVLQAVATVTRLSRFWCWTLMADHALVPALVRTATAQLRRRRAQARLSRRRMDTAAAIAVGLNRGTGSSSEASDDDDYGDGGAGNPKATGTGTTTSVSSRSMWPRRRPTAMKPLRDFVARPATDDADLSAVRGVGSSDDGDDERRALFRRIVERGSLWHRDAFDHAPLQPDRLHAPVRVRLGSSGSSSAPKFADERLNADAEEWPLAFTLDVHRSDLRAGHDVLGSVSGALQEPLLTCLRLPVLRRYRAKLTAALVPCGLGARDVLPLCLAYLFPDIFGQLLVPTPTPAPPGVSQLSLLPLLHQTLEDSAASQALLLNVSSDLERGAPALMLYQLQLPVVRRAAGSTRRPTAIAPPPPPPPAAFRNALMGDPPLSAVTPLLTAVCSLVSHPDVRYPRFSACSAGRAIGIILNLMSVPRPRARDDCDDDDAGDEAGDRNVPVVLRASSRAVLPTNRQVVALLPATTPAVADAATATGLVSVPDTKSVDTTSADSAATTTASATTATADAAWAYRAFLRARYTSALSVARLDAAIEDPDGMYDEEHPEWARRLRAILYPTATTAATAKACANGNKTAPAP